MPEYNKFDVCEAYYLYMMNHHGGQGSIEYALSGTFHRLRFEPRPSLAAPEDLEDNAREIYDRLVRGERTLRDRRA